jgi:isopenicillin-N epimerase
LHRHLDHEWTFVNHGAFGATLSPLLDESNAWRFKCESQPLRFYDRQLLPMVAHTVRETAKYLNCPARELVPLQNVTSGALALLKLIDTYSILLISAKHSQG